MFETRLWRGRRAIPQDMRRPAAEAAHAKNSSIMTPEFEFPNSLIGRERFPVRQFHFPVLPRKIPCSYRQWTARASRSAAGRKEASYECSDGDAGRRAQSRRPLFRQCARQGASTPTPLTRRAARQRSCARRLASTTRPICRLAPTDALSMPTARCSAGLRAAVSAYRSDVTVPRLRPINRQPSLGSITAHSKLRPDRPLPARRELRHGPSGRGTEPRDCGLSGPSGWRVGRRQSRALPMRGQDRTRPARSARIRIASSLHQTTRFIIVADLGLDALIAYPFGPDGHLDKASAMRSPLPQGCGPRHFAFHSGGRIAVVICEINSTIVTLRYHRRQRPLRPDRHRRHGPEGHAGEPLLGDRDPSPRPLRLRRKSWS